MKQEYLMLAHTFKPGKHNIGGWYVSEKLDGMRAFWDGGLSRGTPSRDVPYANTVKDYRLKNEEIATGLWSRTGKVIHAPDAWLNELPAIPLDGELWLGRGCFQSLTKIVSRHTPTEDWWQVLYQVFDSPPLWIMFTDREVKVRDYKFEIKGAYGYRADLDVASAAVDWNFEVVQSWLTGRLGSTVAKLHRQERLPVNYHDAINELSSKLDVFLDWGGEGVMLRKPESFWETRRCYTLLKHKPWNDDEATIIGFTSGRETDKGSRLLGKIGALIVDFNGKRLELSGLTDSERQFQMKDMSIHAVKNPGVDMPEWYQGLHFKTGQIVTFKYRELSDDGVPKEARYWRNKNV